MYVGNYKQYKILCLDNYRCILQILHISFVMYFQNKKYDSQL